MSDRGSDSGDSAFSETAPTGRFRLGDIEFDPVAGEIHGEDVSVGLEPQPARVLELLLDRAGELVPRDEIKRRLWGDRRHVEADQGLNYCISELRRALGDSARDPRYIQTLPRRGYRLIAPVEAIGCAEEGVSGEGRRPPGEGDGSGSVETGAVERPSAPMGSRVRVVLVVAAALCLTLLAGVLVRSGSRSGESRSEAPIVASAWLSEGAVARRGDTEQAERLLVRARFLKDQDDLAQQEKALDLAREALQLGPGHAEAHLLYGQILLDLPRPPRSTVPQAREALSRAVALEPDLAEGYVGLGRIELFYRRRLDAAERSFERALELEPGLADAHYNRALLLAADGRDREAVVAMDRARELDPLSPLIHADLGFIHYFGGRYGEAVAKAREVLSLDPDNLIARLLGLLSAVELGDTELALEHGRRLAALTGGPEARIDTVSDYWRWQLDWYHHERADGRYRSPMVLARAQLNLGREEAALDALEAACEERSGWFMPFLAVDPAWRPLAQRPEFESLLACSRGASG